MSNFNSALHAIHYLLRHTGCKDKISIVKLLFLADKYQLLRIGRTITKSSYVAMYNGPVGSEILDILDRADGTQSKYNRCNIDISSIKAENGGYVIEVPIEYDELSESDEDALKFICDTFQNMSSNALIKYTHRFPEWKQYASHFEQSTSKKNLKEEEMYSVIDGSLGFLPEDIELARSLQYYEE